MEISSDGLFIAGYDANSKPAMVEYDGEMYRYLHNLQGDIVGILDVAGSLVVEYKYDAWGKPISTTGDLSSTLGTLNPFRYRGYVYDEETGLYYLRSRYYNPKWERFISSDALLGKVGVLGTHNLYAYCNNCPVLFSDKNGLYPSVEPSPSRSDNWDAEYLADEQRRRTEQAIMELSNAVADAVLYYRALQLNKYGSGYVITKSKGEFHFLTTAEYDKRFRQDGSSFLSFASTSALSGMISFLSNKFKKSGTPEKLASFAFPLAIIGGALRTIEWINEYDNDRISTFLDQDGVIGTVTYVHYDGTFGWAQPWTADTIASMYGDIISVQLGDIIK